MKLRWLINLSNDIDSARRIKQNPDRQTKSIRFGVTSIVCSLLTIPFCCLIFLFVKSLSSNSFVLIIGGIFLGLLLGLGGVISFLYHSLKSFFLQLYINKKPITWISLAVFILSFIACIFIVYNLLKM